MRKYWFFMAVCGMIGLSLGCSPDLQGAAKTFATGQVFPDFKVKTLDGRQQMDLSSYRGKIVILDLFTTWCPPCRLEIPHLVDLQKKHGGLVAVVGLSYDQGSAENVLKFMQAMKITYPVYWGSEEIARYVGLRGIPQLLVLDAQGKIYRSYVGYQPQETFEADIRALSSAPKKKLP